MLHDRYNACPDTCQPTCATATVIQLTQLSLIFWIGATKRFACFDFRIVAATTSHLRLVTFLAVTRHGLVERLGGPRQAAEARWRVICRHVLAITLSIIVRQARVNAPPSRGGTPHSSLKSIQVEAVEGILACLDHMQAPAIGDSRIALGFSNF